MPPATGTAWAGGAARSPPPQTSVKRTSPGSPRPPRPTLTGQQPRPARARAVAHRANDFRRTHNPPAAPSLAHAARPRPNSASHAPAPKHLRSHGQHLVRLRPTQPLGCAAHELQRQRARVRRRCGEAQAAHPRQDRVAQGWHVHLGLARGGHTHGGEGLEGAGAVGNTRHARQPGPPAKWPSGIQPGRWARCCPWPSRTAAPGGPLQPPCKGSGRAFRLIARRMHCSRGSAHSCPTPWSSRARCPRPRTHSLIKPASTPLFDTSAARKSPANNTCGGRRSATAAPAASGKAPMA